MRPPWLEPTVIDAVEPGLAVGSHRVEARARISTWRVSGPDRSRPGWTHVRPVAVRVEAPDGSSEHLEIRDVTAEALRGMATAGVVVASTAASVMFLLGWLTRPGSPGRSARKEPRR